MDIEREIYRMCKQKEISYELFDVLRELYKKVDRIENPPEMII